MEKKLELIVDLLEIYMNFLLVVCLELMPYGFFGPEDPSVALFFLPMVFPLAFYAARRWLDRSLLLFLAAHAAVIFGVFKLVQLWHLGLFWEIVCPALGVVYAFLSVKIRVTTQKNAEGVVHPVVAGAVAGGSFLLCSYLKFSWGCEADVWLTFAWMPAWFVRSYFLNYLSYLRLNRQSSGIMPRRSIFSMGFAVAGGYSFLSVALLILCTRTPLTDLLTSFARSVIVFLLRAVFAILAFFAGEQGPQIAEDPAAAAAGGEAMPFLEEGAVPPLWVQILEQIAIMAVLLGVLAGILLLIAAFVRFIIRGFYGRENVARHEELELGVTEEQERIDDRKERRERRLPPIGGSPGERVRRSFRRTVQRTALKDKKTDWTARTARELARDGGGPEAAKVDGVPASGKTATGRNGPATVSAQAVGTPGAVTVSGRVVSTSVPDAAGAKTAAETSAPAAQAWKELVLLYEKTRYGQSGADREDAREADKLSRQILHNMK